MFDLRLMPLLLIGNPVIVLNPHGPKHIVTSKVPNLNSLGEPHRNPLSKEGLFPMDDIIVTGPDLT